MIIIKWSRNGKILLLTLYMKFQAQEKSETRELVIFEKLQNKLNNNLSNLRWATVSENAMNSKVPSHNTTGVKGVWKNGKNGKYVAEIKVNGKKYNLGTFSKLDDAKEARKEGEIKYFGEFA